MPQTAEPSGTYSHLAFTFPANLTELKGKRCFSTEDSPRIFFNGIFTLRWQGGSEEQAFP